MSPVSLILTSLFVRIMFSPSQFAFNQSPLGPVDALQKMQLKNCDKYC